MRARLRSFRNRRSFAKAKARASEGEMVNAVVLPNGKPVYFVTPRNLPDEALESKVFELRHGRPVTTGERMLRAAAEARRK